jgi:hypothetical protein
LKLVEALLVEREPFPSHRVVEHRPADAAVQVIDRNGMAAGPDADHHGADDNEGATNDDDPLAERQAAKCGRPHR